MDWEAHLIMSLRQTTPRRSAVLLTKVLVVLLLALSPRALLAPVASFNRALESKRPKVPRNVVRAEPVRISNLEKQGQASPPPRKDAPRHDHEGWLAGASVPPSPPCSALIQLTKPDYLKLHSAALPQHHLDPPA